MTSPIAAAGVCGSRPAAPSVAVPSAADGAERAPLDDTAESVPDTAATLAEAFSRRAELIMIAQQSRQQEMQARLDVMKANFNATTELHTERLRELNALRDMAMDQAKKDDEILKKYIAMI